MKIRSAWAVGALALALCAVPVATAASEATDSGELALRVELQSATWPGDVVRLVDGYLRRYPDTLWRPSAEVMRLGALDALRALSRQDVALFRTAFNADAQDEAAVASLRRAAVGDKDAAMQLARQAQRSGDIARYVGWLQFAATLGHERASYELAVHYRRQDQPAMASRYEARAVEMGYEMPTWLDHRRK
jgi:hypothetical protein